MASLLYKDAQGLRSGNFCKFWHWKNSKPPCLTCLHSRQQMLAISSNKEHVCIMNWAIYLQPANWSATTGASQSWQKLWCALHVNFAEKNAVRDPFMCRAWPIYVSMTAPNSAPVPAGGLGRTAWAKKALISTELLCRLSLPAPPWAWEAPLPAATPQASRANQKGHDLNDI